MNADNALLKKETAMLDELVTEYKAFKDSCDNETKAKYIKSIKAAKARIVLIKENLDVSAAIEFVEFTMLLVRRNAYGEILSGDKIDHMCIISAGSCSYMTSQSLPKGVSMAISRDPMGIITELMTFSAPDPDIHKTFKDLVNDGVKVVAFMIA